MVHCNETWLHAVLSGAVLGMLLHLFMFSHFAFIVLHFRPMGELHLASAFKCSSYAPQSHIFPSSSVSSWSRWRVLATVGAVSHVKTSPRNCPRLVFVFHLWIQFHSRKEMLQAVQFRIKPLGMQRCALCQHRRPAPNSQNWPASRVLLLKQQERQCLVYNEPVKC